MTEPLTQEQKENALLARTVLRLARDNNTEAYAWLEEIHALSGTPDEITKLRARYDEGEQVLTNYTMHNFESYQALEAAQSAADALIERGYQTLIDMDNTITPYNVYGFRERA